MYLLLFLFFLYRKSRDSSCFKIQAIFRAYYAVLQSSATCGVLCTNNIVFNLVENQLKPQVPYETPEINLVKLPTHTIATIQGPYTELAV